MNLLLDGDGRRQNPTHADTNFYVATGTRGAWVPSLSSVAEVGERVLSIKSNSSRQSPLLMYWVLFNKVIKTITLEERKLCECEHRSCYLLISTRPWWCWLCRWCLKNPSELSDGRSHICTFAAYYDIFQTPLLSSHSLQKNKDCNLFSSRCL